MIRVVSYQISGQRRFDDDGTLRLYSVRCSNSLVNQFSSRICSARNTRSDADRSCPVPSPSSSLSTFGVICSDNLELVTYEYLTNLPNFAGLTRSNHIYSTTSDNGGFLKYDGGADTGLAQSLQRKSLTLIRRQGLWLSAMWICMFILE